jgi:MFS family permease
MQDQKTSNRDGSPPHLPVGRLKSYIILFSENKRYRQFWLAGVISQIGNWFNYIAIFVLLTKLTGSGTAISWFLIAKFIPTSVLGPAAGVIADRFSRKTIMIASDILRAAIVLCFLFIRRPDQVWLVYLLALVQESIWTFYDPARRASVPNICRPHELVIANALSGATWSMMLAFGAALGGFVTMLFGWQTAILLDSISFLVSAWIMSRIELAHEGAVYEKSATWMDYTGINDLLEGCKYVARHKEVGILLLVKSGWALSGGILVMLTVFGEQVFSGNGAGGRSGLLYSFRGLGAAIGPLLAWHFMGESRPAMYRAISFSFFISSGAYLLFAQAPSLAWALPCVLVGHLGGSVQWVFSTTLLQKLVPNHFRGRVFAAEMALLTFILSLSTYFTGAALDCGLDPRLITIRLAMLFLLPGSFWVVYLRRQKHS